LAVSAPGVKVEPPAGLSDESKQLWERICEESAIDAAAASILRTLCEANDRRNEARAAISRDGAVLKDRFGQYKRNPWSDIEISATQIMHRAFRLLGFDQEARGSDGQGELFR
jgi:P27 family predicted phage terminase small subunit